MKSRGASARGLGLTVAMLLGSGRLWAQAAEPLPPPPPAPLGVDPPVAAAPVAGPPPPSPPATSPAPSNPDVPRTAPFEPERSWYGWQLMLNDFVALGAIGGAAVAGLKGKAALGVIVPAAVVFDLGGPAIHWLHHRRGIAAASFGVRVGAPFVGVLIGSAMARCERGSSSCSNRGAGYGALAGFAAATALDASLFAWDAPDAEPRRAIGLAWVPTFTPLDGGAAAGVVGSF